MAEPAEGASKPTELDVTYGLAVRVPSRQQAFVITVADWNHTKELITPIRSLESQWYTAAWSFLTLGASFLAGFLVLVEQQSVAFGFRGSFLALTAVGFTSSLLCFIAYLTDRRRRRDQGAIALQYMDQIETNLTRPPAL